MVFVLGVDHHRVITVAVGTTHQRDAEAVPVVGGGHRERDVVAGSQAVVQHKGVITREGAVDTAHLGTVAGHHLDGLLLVELSSDSRHLAHGERTVGMLDDLVAYQRTRPVGLATGTHVDVLVVDGVAGAVGAPTPDVAVLTVASRLAGIESAGVEHALMTVAGPVGTGIVEAGLQSLPSGSHHVLHLAAP